MFATSCGTLQRAGFTSEREGTLDHPSARTNGGVQRPAQFTVAWNVALTPPWNQQYCHLCDFLGRFLLGWASMDCAECQGFTAERLHRKRIYEYASVKLRSADASFDPERYMSLKALAGRMLPLPLEPVHGSREFVATVASHVRHGSTSPLCRFFACRQAPAPYSPSVLRYTRGHTRLQSRAR